MAVSCTHLENINVSVKNWVPKVVVTVPLIGYLMAATESTEGIIVLALAVLFLIILYVIAELWKKPETLDAVSYTHLIFPNGIITGTDRSGSSGKSADCRVWSGRCGFLCSGGS